MREFEARNAFSRSHPRNACSKKPATPQIVTRQLEALYKRLAELDAAILILRSRSHRKKRRDPTSGDPLPSQGNDQDQTSLSASLGDNRPSTSRKGSRGRSSSIAHGETEREIRGSLSKRKRSSGGSRHSLRTATGVDNSGDSDCRDGDHDGDEASIGAASEGGGGGDDKASAGATGKRAAASGGGSRKSSNGSTSSAKADPKKHMEEAMLSLLVLIDENTARIDSDLASLESNGSASAES